MAPALFGPGGTGTAGQASAGHCRATLPQFQELPGGEFPPDVGVAPRGLRGTVRYPRHPFALCRELHAALALNHRHG